MKELLVGIQEQCKTELIDEWAREEQASEQKIEQLERQLAEERKVGREWREKYLKLEARVQRLLSRD
jgi:molecular chaperone GrpE (heat shock protein)